MVVEPTQFKSMLTVKLDHFPKVRDENLWIQHLEEYFDVYLHVPATAIQHRILEISRFFFGSTKNIGYSIVMSILLKGSEHTFSGGLLQALCPLKIAI